MQGLFTEGHRGKSHTFVSHPITYSMKLSITLFLSLIFIQRNLAGGPDQPFDWQQKVFIKNSSAGIITTVKLVQA